MNCKNCKHPYWTHHLVSGVCETVYFKKPVKIPNGYNFEIDNCNCKSFKIT